MSLCILCVLEGRALDLSTGHCFGDCVCVESVCVCGVARNRICICTYTDMQCNNLMCTCRLRHAVITYMYM